MAVSSPFRTRWKLLRICWNVWLSCVDPLVNSTTVASREAGRFLNTHVSAFNGPTPSSETNIVVACALAGGFGGRNEQDVPP
jgi:hypothetical protein